MRDSLEMVLRTESALRCDECGRTLTISPEETQRAKTTAEIVVLYPGWRVVAVEGWVGDYHACSDDCEAKIHRRFGPKPN